MQDVKDISFSLTYNPEELEITSLSSENGTITDLSNEDGIKSVIINFAESIDLNSGDNIVNINASKKSESTHINILNANFTDSADENYLLSTSGLTY